MLNNVCQDEEGVVTLVTSPVGGCIFSYGDKGRYQGANTERLIGYASRTRHLQVQTYNYTEKLFFDHNTPDHSARYFAIVKNTKTDEIKKYNLTMRDEGKANNQFSELTKENHMIGAFGYDGQNPRWIRFVTRASEHADVDQMLGQFAQKRLNRCTDTTRENRSYATKNQRDEQRRNYGKAVRRKHEQNKKFVADLRAHKAKHPALRDRFPRAVHFSIYSFRPGYKIRGTTRFWKVSYAALSYAEILDKAANRIQSFFNWEN